MSDGAGAPGRVRLAVPSVRVVAGLCLSTLIAGLGAVAVSAQGSGGCALTGFSPGSGLIWESDADLVRDLDEMVAVGGQWLRIDVAWSSTEPQKGTFQWGPVDRVVNAASSRGIKIIGLLHLTPAWARAAGTDSAMYPPLNPAEFANFAKLATERYSTKVKVWEIWNEPNIPVFWRPKPDVAAYTALLKPAYAAIKAADSGATVLSAGLSPAVDAPDGSEVSPATYLTGVYQNGGKGSFDAVAVHPYSYPARPLDPATAHYNTFYRLPLVYDVMVANGDGDKSMWLTEFGAPTGTHPTAVSETEQAAILGDAFNALPQLPWAKNLLVYATRDAGTDLSDREDNFGLLRRGFSPKPARDGVARAAAACGPSQQATLSVGDASVTEGAAGTSPMTFTVSRGGDTAQPVSAVYTTVAGTAEAGSDFAAVPPTTVSFAAGEKTKAVTVNVNGDALPEATETFFLKLSSPNGAALADDTGVGTVLNDDAMPSLGANDVTVVEGLLGTTLANFTVTRNGNTTGSSSVQYRVEAGTAVAGRDFVAVPLTTLSFAPGETAKTVPVTIIGNSLPDTAATFFVRLSSPVGATLGDDTGAGTILNDDSGQPTGVAVDDVTVLEGGSGSVTATFTLTRSGPTGGTSSVQYITGSNTASGGVDYLRVPLTTATFGPGETTKTVPVTVVGDVVGELNETFVLNLSAPVSTTLTDAQGLATIVDDDPTLVPGPSSFVAVNDVTVVEGQSGTVPATFTLTRSGDTSAAASVQYRTESTTATADVDHQRVPSTTVTFGPGETTKAVTVNVNGDTVAELTEELVVRVSSPSGVTIADDAGVARIVNDDAGIPTRVSVNDVVVAEGSSGTTAATFTVTRSGGVTAASSVQYSTAPETATPGSDYTTVPTTNLPFAPGETAKTVTVNLIADTVAEATETLLVKLSSPSGAVVSDDTGLATVTDDDQVLSTVAINDVTVTEGNVGTVTALFTISRSGNTTGAASVQYITGSNTASGDVDYLRVPMTTVSFAPGETTKTVPVTVVADVLAEPNETFFLNLSGPVGASFADAQGVATIVNDDGLLLTPGPATFLAISDVIVSEGASGTKAATFTITRSGNSGNVSVQYATTGAGTATAGVDYVNVPPTTVSFATRETAKPVSVTINGDAVPEGNEAFFVKLSSPTGAVISDDVGNGTILNDDAGPADGFSVNDVVVPEGNAGNAVATFTITRAGNTSGTASVQYATAPLTATAGTDYVSVPLTTVTFAAGQTARIVSVSVVGDTTTETDEAFLVTLSTPTGAAIADATGGATLTDDDTPHPSVAVSDVTVTEGNAGTVSATLTVTRTGNTGVASSVQYSTAPGTAAAGTDYTSVPLTTLSFAPGETAKTLTVAVVGDTVGEPNETLVVNLSRPVAAAIADAQATVTIVNDDVTIQPGPSTFLAVTDVTVKEANSGSTPATFTLSRSGDTTGSSSVRYATTDGGTATADSDFVAVAVTTVSFGPDETTKSVTVSVTGDVALEPDETFFVKLSSPSGATISDDEGKGIITNDDILPNLSVTDVAVVEGSASTVDATFTIIRSGDVSRSSSLRYGTAAGSASAGTDYVEVSSGTATFAPGETVKTVAVGVRGDTTPEADETFVLKLSSPVDATLSDDSGTATILNDDVLPTFAVNDVTLFETNAQTTAILSVTRAGDASGTSSVAYAMAGVTASAGSDFVAISGRLTFAPGERIKIVTVTVVGDTVAEPNEVLSLTLSAPTGATIGDDQGSATILNDD